MEAEQQIRCGCGRCLIERRNEIASRSIRNHMHKVSTLETALGIEIRGRCPGCSKFHSLRFPGLPAPTAPPRKRKSIMSAIGQLTLF
jgi:hypothetical protein